MKKRLLPILMAILMVFTMIPALSAAVYAEDGGGSPAVSLGAGEIANGSRVWFGQYNVSPILWRVLADGTDTRLPVSRKGEALLISSDILASIQFNLDPDAEDANVWFGSNAQTWCRDFLSNWTDGSAEKAAIRKTTVCESSNYTYNDTVNDYSINYGPASLDDCFFFLSAQSLRGMA